MTEAFERKRAIRSANRGVITKYVKVAIELFSKIDENGCIERLITLDRLLDEKLKFVRKLDEEILEACSVESIAQDIEEAEEITSKVYDTRKKIETILTKKPTNPVGGTLQLPTPLIDSSPPGNLLNTQGTLIDMTQEEINEVSNPIANASLPTSSTARPRLPKLTLPKLRGEITKFLGFWESFQSAVHNNSDLTEIDKFNYLYSLLEGPGLRAIQGIAITAENYKSAIDILNERFGKTQQVISAHMDKLLKLPTCNGSDPRSGSTRSL